MSRSTSANEFITLDEADCPRPFSQSTTNEAAGRDGRGRPFPIHPTSQLTSHRFWRQWAVRRFVERFVGLPRRRKKLARGAVGLALAGMLLIGRPAPAAKAAGMPDFSPPQTNPLGLTDVGKDSTPSWADIDGDGDLDAFVGEQYGDTFFFENTGSQIAPAFAAAQTNPFGLAAVAALSDPSLTDIDADGDFDAFVGDRNGNINFFKNTGSSMAPAFAAVQSNPFNLADVGSKSSPSWADIDADGDLDAFVGEGNGGTIFFANTGSATKPAFATPKSNHFGLVDVGFDSKPSWADLDLDGDLDGFVGEKDGNTFYFENTASAASPAFAPAQVNPFGLADVWNGSSPSWADIDGDGDLDAFVGEWYGTIFFFENTGSTIPPRFSDPQSNPFGLTDLSGSSLSSPSWADIDVDGDLDAFVGEFYGSTFFFENTGGAATPAFAAPQSDPFGLADVGYWSSPSWTDIDGDGDLDAFVGEYYGSTFFFENTGNAATPAFSTSQSNPFGLADVGFESSPSWADLDGDGDFDAFIGEAAGNIKFFENSGSHIVPAFATPQNNPFGLAAVGLNGSPSWADLDQDGDLDAFVGETDGSTFFFENTGSASVPAFAAPQSNPFGLADAGSYTNPSWADIDGDGDLDAFVGERYVTAQFFENRSSLQQVSLDSGWNMVSLETAPDDNAIGSVLADILGSVALVKNGAGEVFWPAYGVDQIGEWEAEEAYQVYMNSPAALIVEGVEIKSSETPIQLSMGWYMAAYLKDAAMPVESAMADILGDLVLVKDGDGNVYWPAMGINTIGDMQPGMGYQIYMSGAASLVYPEG